LNRPTIVTVHRIKGRVRFKLSHPIRDIEEARNFLLEYEGIRSFEYNEVTRSALIYYESQRVDLKEIANRLAVAYSRQYDLMPVNVFVDSPNKHTPLAYYSIGSIILAGVLKWLKIGHNTEVESNLNWIVLGTTAGAIIEHGYKELKEKGGVDPELASFMYFINSIRNKKYISGSLFTWIAIFGRHMAETNYKGATVKVREVENASSGEVSYEIDVKKGISLGEEGKLNILSYIKEFLTGLFEKDHFKVAQGVFMGNSMMSGRGGQIGSIGGACKKMCM
jgi:hypothetical protein